MSSDSKPATFDHNYPPLETGHKETMKHFLHPIHFHMLDTYIGTSHLGSILEPVSNHTMILDIFQTKLSDSKLLHTFFCLNKAKLKMKLSPYIQEMNPISLLHCHRVTIQYQPGPLCPQQIHPLFPMFDKTED